MVKRGKIFLNKRGDVITPEVIFIIVNLLFFIAVFVFIETSSKGALAYEQAYAKQIALAVDATKPFTQISIDFKNGLDLTKGKTEGVVSFSNNEVIVNLRDKGGYGFKYFSDYKVEYFFAGNDLVMTIKNKNG